MLFSFLISYSTPGHVPNITAVQLEPKCKEATHSGLYYKTHWNRHLGMFSVAMVTSLNIQAWDPSFQNDQRHSGLRLRGFFSLYALITSDECHAWFHLNAASPTARNTEQVNITKKSCPRGRIRSINSGLQITSPPFSPLDHNSLDMRWN